MMCAQIVNNNENTTQYKVMKLNVNQCETETTKMDKNEIITELYTVLFDATITDSSITAYDMMYSA